MNKVFGIFVALMAMFAIQAKADNTLSVSNLTGVTDDQVTLSVNMSNSDNIVALSFDLTLPTGVTIAKSGDGYKVSLASSRKTSSHTITCGDPQGGAYSVAAYSSSNAAFKGTSGAVVTVVLDIAGSANLGENTIKVSNIELAKSDLTPVNPADVTGTITIKKVSGTQTIAQLGSIGTPSADDISAAGGSSKAYANVSYKYWTRTSYSDGTYEDSSVTNSTYSISGESVSASNLGTEVTKRTKIGTSTPTGELPYKDEDGKAISVTASACDVYQQANQVETYDDVNIAFVGGQTEVTIPAGDEFDLSRIVAVSQNATYTSGAKGNAPQAELFYRVKNEVEGFNPVALTEDAAEVSVQSTASVEIAKGYIVRVLALGAGNKVAVADVEFSATTSTDVNSVKTRVGDDSKIYDLKGRIVPVNNTESLQKGVYIVGNKKIAVK